MHRVQLASLDFWFFSNLFVDPFFHLQSMLLWFCMSFAKFQFNYYYFFFFSNYSINSSRLDMCRRNYPTDVCNRGTAGKCDFIAGTTSTWLYICSFQFFAYSFHIFYHFVVQMYKISNHTFYTIDVQIEIFNQHVYLGENHIWKNED